MLVQQDGCSALTACGFRNHFGYQDGLVHPLAYKISQLVGSESCSFGAQEAKEQGGMENEGAVFSDWLPLLATFEASANLNVPQSFLSYYGNNTLCVPTFWAFVRFH